MRNLWRAFPILLLTLAFARIGAAVPAQPGFPSMSVQTSGEKSLEAKGELQKVDTTNQTFTIKTASGEEMQFEYSSSTKVAGTTEGVQGLSSETGTQVTVRYKEESGRKVATEIEINKKGANQ